MNTFELFIRSSDAVTGDATTGSYSVAIGNFLPPNIHQFKARLVQAAFDTSSLLPRVNNTNCGLVDISVSFKNVIAYDTSNHVLPSLYLAIPAGIHLGGSRLVYINSFCLADR